MSLFNFTSDSLIQALVDNAIETRDNQCFCYACDDDPAYLSGMEAIEELLAHLAYEWWIGRFDKPYKTIWDRMFPDDFVGGESFYTLPDQCHQKVFAQNRKMNRNDQNHYDLRQAASKK